jgi:hypothetical protein
MDVIVPAEYPGQCEEDKFFFVVACPVLDFGEGLQGVQVLSVIDRLVLSEEIPANFVGEYCADHK